MPLYQTSSSTNDSCNTCCASIRQFAIQSKSSEAVIGILTLMDADAEMYLHNTAIGGKLSTASLLEDLNEYAPGPVVEIKSILSQFGESLDTVRILHQNTIAIPIDPEKTAGSMHDDGYLPTSGLYASYTSLK